MALCYSDILSQNADFQRAVNLSLDQGSLALVEKYIPTVSSTTVMARYLNAVIKPGNDRASILIGPYGKGKSHTLFVTLSVLFEEGEQADLVFERLAEKIENVSEETANLIRQVRQAKIRLLPVVVNDRYLDVKQAFLASLKTALATANLSGIMPDNYYKQCLETINRWKKDFPLTHKDYQAYLKTLGLNASDFETRLKQFDAEALSIFRECHRKILAGAEFEPLLESDVPSLYCHVNEALCTQTKYSGLFIVFDEFGKYLESTESNGDRFKVLQDLAEFCSRSSEQRMLLSCVSHKAISEYANHLNQVKKSSFRTIEGRFEPIYFTSTFEGSFSLIAGALGRNKARYVQFVNEHIEERKKTLEECEHLGCFAGYENSVDQIVSQCFPMHPLTTLSLMRLSEQAAQNERTLFTFLSDPDSPLASFIRKNQGQYQLAPVPMVYDYFHATIRENSYDKELRSSIIYVDSVIPTLDADAGDLIKAIMLFSMVADNCLMSTKQILLAALQWDEKHFNRTLQQLEQAHHIYIRRSDGVICLMRSTAENIRYDIEHETAKRKRIDIADQMTELHDPGYTVPRRYNDKHEIVRFFQNVFVSADNFGKQKNSGFLIKKGVADGYVIHLLGSMAAEDVQSVLRKWNDPKVIVLLPTIEFIGQTAIEECAAIKSLLEHPTDEIAAEELSYYFEDMLQMVNQSYSKLFGKGALLVTMDGVSNCTNLSLEVSELCEKRLYPDCPIICHEMINRSVISGQMKQSRGRVIDAIFNENDFLNAFSLKTAEGPIMRAVLGHLQDEKMKAVIGRIQDYIGKCEEEKKPISGLYDILLNAPYGMRKGVIPILLAYCLRDKYQNTVLYNRGQEIALSGEALNALDEHNVDYEILVDKGSSEQAAYIQCLYDKYTPNDPVPNVRSIYEAMCKIVRALPRSARANRKMLCNDNGVLLPTNTVEIRNALIRFDSNARDVVINRIPKKTGSPYATEACAHTVIDALQSLEQYTKGLLAGIRQCLCRRLNGTTNQSVRGMMTVWLQKQPTSHLNHSFSSSTSALLNVIRSKENYAESEWMNMIAVALTGLPVEDWSDTQVDEFSKMLNNALLEIESIHDEDVNAESGAHVRLSIGGRALEQALPNQEIEGMASVAYDSVRSALNEFGESLTTDEKLLILANLMLHINE